ncbi:hypothetical protein A7981_06325 [Methylovorus sp. MM2]|uniref:hypothetical protein n=1 Tax=Methylovorus sp. MM2 TaxID=1848038 RepID=UPI0007DF889D|nr:hypothetical protein [Methylovorus sp. MM2]OAM53034.1 hypothetical protein A7981_06325 [Methylovorus sp. MM2]
MQKARIFIVLLGISLPYIARLPKGMVWLAQYTDGGLDSFLFIEAFNAIAWGILLGVSFFYRHSISLAIPTILGFGFLAWVHYTLDLAADAQSALAFIFIPIYACIPILIGGIFGYGLDKYLSSFRKIKDV